MRTCEVAGSAQGTGVGVGKGGDEMFRKCGDPKTDLAYHLSFVFVFVFVFFGIFPLSCPAFFVCKQILFCR